MQTDDPMDYRIADLRIRIPGECLPGPLHPAFSPFAEPENGTPALLLHTARQIADVPEECCLDRFPCIDTTTECRFIRWSGGIQLELYGPQGIPSASGCPTEAVKPAPTVTPTGSRRNCASGCGCSATRRALDTGSCRCTPQRSATAGRACSSSGSRGQGKARMPGCGAGTQPQPNCSTTTAPSSGSNRPAHRWSTDRPGAGKALLSAAAAADRRDRPA